MSGTNSLGSAPDIDFISKNSDAAPEVIASSIPNIDGTNVGERFGGDFSERVTSNRAPSLTSLAALMAGIPTGNLGSAKWSNFISSMVASKELQDLKLSVQPIVSPAHALVIYDRISKKSVVLISVESVESNLINNLTPDGFPCISYFDAICPIMARLVSNRGQGDIVKVNLLSLRDVETCFTAIRDDIVRTFMYYQGSIPDLTAQQFSDSTIRVTYNREHWNQFMSGYMTHEIGDRNDVTGVITIATNTRGANQNILGSIPIGAFSAYTTFVLANDNAHTYQPIISIRCYSVLEGKNIAMAVIAIAVQSLMSQKMWAVPYRAIHVDSSNDTSNNLGLLFTDQQGVPRLIENDSELMGIMNTFKAPIVTIVDDCGRGGSISISELLNNRDNVWNISSNAFVGSQSDQQPLLAGQNPPRLVNQFFSGEAKLNGGAINSEWVDYLHVKSANPKDNGAASLLSMPAIPADGARILSGYVSDFKPIYTSRRFAISDDALNPIHRVLASRIVAANGVAAAPSIVDFSQFANYSQGFVNAYNTASYFQSPYATQSSVPVFGQYQGMPPFRT